MLPTSLLGKFKGKIGNKTGINSPINSEEDSSLGLGNLSQGVLSSINSSIPQKTTNVNGKVLTNNQNDARKKGSDVANSLGEAGISSGNPYGMAIGAGLLAGSTIDNGVQSLTTNSNGEKNLDSGSRLARGISGKLNPIGNISSTISTLQDGDATTGDKVAAIATSLLPYDFTSNGLMQRKAERVAKKDQQDSLGTALTNSNNNGLATMGSNLVRKYEDGGKISIPTKTNSYGLNISVEHFDQNSDVAIKQLHSAIGFDPTKYSTVKSKERAKVMSDDYDNLVSKFNQLPENERVSTFKNKNYSANNSQIINAPKDTNKTNTSYNEKVNSINQKQVAKEQEPYNTQVQQDAIQFENLRKTPQVQQFETAYKTKHGKDIDYTFNSKDVNGYDYKTAYLNNDFPKVTNGDYQLDQKYANTPVIDKSIQKTIENQVAHKKYGGKLTEALENQPVNLISFPIKKDGGKINTLEGDLISKVIMNRNKDKDFVKRAYDLNNPRGTGEQKIVHNLDGSLSSHLMWSGEKDNGQAIMFPELENKNGKLQPLGNGNPQEVVEIPNQYADYISSTGYKKASGMLKEGGLIPKGNLLMANGPKHEEGGINLKKGGKTIANIEGGETVDKDKSFVFSDSINYPNTNKSIADVSKDIAHDKKELNSLAKLQESMKNVNLNKSIFKKYGGGISVKDTVVNNENKKMLFKDGKPFVPSIGIKQMANGGMLKKNANALPSEYLTNAGYRPLMRTPTLQPKGISASLDTTQMPNTIAKVPSTTEVQPIEKAKGKLDLSNAMGYADNLTNAVLNQQRSNAAIPNQANTPNYTPNLVDYSAQRAEADRQLTGFNRATDKIAGPQGLYARASALASNVQSKNEITNQEKNANVGIKNEANKINTDIATGNNEMNLKNQLRQIGAKDDIRRETSSNVSNAVEKFRTNKLSDAKREVDLENNATELASKGLNPQQIKSLLKSKEFTKKQLQGKKYGGSLKDAMKMC